MSGQTEIKLVVDEGCKPKVLAGLDGGAGKPSTYEGIYFDTDNLDLRHRRITLCLRLIARIPESETYPELAREGLTVFDRKNKAALEQQQAWMPLVRAVETHA